MTDQDVIDRLYEIVRVGSVHAYAARSQRSKPSWRLSLARREYISWLAEYIAPMMSVRRHDAMERLAGNFHPPFPIPEAANYFPELPDLMAAAWLAGIIEGDGHILPQEVGVHSIDQDVIERIRAIAGRGQIYPVRRQKAHHKDGYAWKVTSRANILYVLDAIRPWLLARRSAAATVVLRGRGQN